MNPRFRQNLTVKIKKMLFFSETVSFVFFGLNVKKNPFHLCKKRQLSLTPKFVKGILIYKSVLKKLLVAKQKGKKYVGRFH